MDGSFLREWWAVIVGAVGVIGWMVRMEGGMLANRKEIERLWMQRKEDGALARESRDEMKAILREMRDEIREVRNDIKHINRGTP